MAGSWHKLKPNWKLGEFGHLTICPTRTASPPLNSGVERRHMKRIARLVHFAVLFGISAGTYGAEYALKLEDWKHHPDVKAVREIYDEIKAGIKDNSYKSRTRKFDVESASCESHPLKSETLVSDTAGRVRLYKIEQLGSHREPFTIERYYDSNGQLRFVFVERLFSNERVYLNSAGNVFWAVEQRNNKLTVSDSSSDDWEMRPNSARKAKEEFGARQRCPEITK